MSRSSYGYDVTTISGNQSWLFIALDAVPVAVSFENITSVVHAGVLQFGDQRGELLVDVAG